MYFKKSSVQQEIRDLWQKQTELSFVEKTKRETLLKVKWNFIITNYLRS